MTDLREHFLSDSAVKLTELLAQLARKESISGSDRSAAFRILHTIKGTSQTFGLGKISRVAHLLEDILASDSNFEKLVLGIELLKNGVATGDLSAIDEFLKANDSAFIIQRSADFNFHEIPTEFVSKLSAQEKTELNRAIESGNTIFGLRASFELASFANDLTQFKSKLADLCDFTATFPSSIPSAPGSISFEFIGLCDVSVDLVEFCKKFSKTEILFEIAKRAFTNDLAGVLKQVESHAVEIGKKCGKHVEFETVGGDISISETNLAVLFASFTHLVRNAVDHAFERHGRISISLETDAETLYVKVSDNGRGINPLDLLAENDSIDSTDREATLQKIFQSEFSTASKVTETSGRGVGLDAVKTAVESIGGSIMVSSQVNIGTTFEISLPL